MRFNITIIRP